MIFIGERHQLAVWPGTVALLRCDRHIFLIKAYPHLIKKISQMKNKFLLACIVGLLSASTMYGRTAAETGYAGVIRDFIDSHMTSNFKKLKSIMSDNSVLKLPRGEKVLVQEKDDLVSMMKKDAGTQQNCQSGYEVLAKSDAMVIARVDFNYENCAQHDYLIIEKNERQDWKITQVCKMFEDIKTPLNNDNSVVAKN
ncbi:hypothetical protein DIU36_30030 [Mucilaginibacter rubeus]|nr:hypothetical protein DIU36_30030 [Mucilaginibacter rubeus]